MSSLELNERARQLLKTLVERYIREGQPVGSRTLARDSGMELSPATIRNVVSDLEELGLVVSPHTSAGRIPTVKGYRLFIDSLLSIRPLKEKEVRSLQAQFETERDPQQVITSASALLSELTSMAGLVMLPKRSGQSLHQMEFLPLSDNRVLVILILSDREVQNRIIHTDRSYGSAELQQVANYLNQALAGKRISDVRETLLREMADAQRQMSRLMQDAIRMAQQTFAEEGAEEDFMLAGETNLMGYEEMADMGKLRQLFEAFNRKREILQILDQSLSADSMQIFIGHESGYSPLQECSVVTTPYSVEGETVGVLGVIGPTRMDYQRVIPIVDVTAKLLGAALNARQ